MKIQNGVMNLIGESGYPNLTLRFLPV